MTVLTAELRIVGSDKSGAAFAGVIAHARELQKTLGNMRGMGVGDAKIAAMNAELRKGTAQLRSQNMAWREINRSIALGNSEIAARAGLMSRMKGHFAGLAGASGMGWMIGGLASGRAASAIAHDTANYEHQRAQLSAAGMSRAEIKEAVAQSFGMRVPGMSATDNLRSIGELRTVFGSTEEALKNAVTVQRAAATMKALNPDMDAHNESYNLARALELKGVSMDPAHFRGLSDRLVQAMNASRGKVTGQSMFEFTQYARGAARNLSDDFYTRVAPSLIQEMKPTSAGRAISSLYEQVVGGKMKLQAATEWMKLGLLDPNKVHLNKIGTVKRLEPGAFVNSALFVSDPYAWIQRYLAPALKKHGITDKAKVAEELAHLFSNMYAEQMAGILLTQKQRIEKDWGLYAGGAHIDYIDKLVHSDPLFAARDLGAAINTLLSSFGSPLAAAAIGVMNGLATAGRFLGENYEKLSTGLPVTAGVISGLGAGGLLFGGLKGLQATFGLMTGATALKGSAVSLTGSAEALTAAAIKLAGGSLPGVVGTAEKIAKGSVVLAGGVVGGVVVGGAALAEVANNQVWSNPAYFTGSMDPEGYGFGAAVANLNRPKVDELADFNARRFTLDDIRAAVGLDPLPRRGGIGSDFVTSMYAAVHDRGEPPKAELTGEAHITQTIKVEESPNLITQIHTMISNAISNVIINGDSPGKGTTGSSGRSMPEAQQGGAW